MAPNMELVCLSKLTTIYIKEILEITSSMAMESISSKMEKSILDNSKIMHFMVNIFLQSLQFSIDIHSIG